MSNVLESRISQAATVLGLTAEQLKDALKTLGIEDNDSGLDTLAFITVEELQAAVEGLNKTLEGSKLVVPTKLPLPKIRHAYAILLATSDKKESSEDKIISALRPMGQWSDEELVKEYSKDCPIEIGEQLKKRTNGRPVIIFNEDETVDINTTLKLVKMARHQNTPGTFVIGDGDTGRMVKVYPVGYFPKTTFQECPVHPHILLVDGYCEECGYKWSESSDEKNVFLRVVLGEERGVDFRIYRTKSFEQLTKDFPKSFLKYQELKEIDQLPRLKRNVSKSRSGEPFGVTENKTW